MQRSGNRLVLALGLVALVSGGLSWWYHYAASHRATEFWGSDLASLIARPSQVEVARVETLDEPALSELFAGDRSVNLTHARGMVHLRHALMSDRNFFWDQPVAAEEISWQWCLRFTSGSTQGLVLLSSDLAFVAKFLPARPHIEAVSCQPMAASLQYYFQDLNLVDASGP